MNHFLLLFAKVMHLFGLFCWLGGLIGLLVLLRVMHSHHDQINFIMVRRAMRTVVVPGLLLAWAGGLYLLLQGWSIVYAKAPWMHTKLLIAFLLSAATGMVSAKLRRLAKQDDNEASPTRVGGYLLFIMAFVLVALVLVVVRPG
ncbi:MAG: CopD family protein [Polyangiales bacterium]